MDTQSAGINQRSWTPINVKIVDTKIVDTH